jgi:hypothetical protein
LFSLAYKHRKEITKEKKPVEGINKLSRNSSRLSTHAFAIYIKEKKVSVHDLNKSGAKEI